MPDRLPEVVLLCAILISSNVRTCGLIIYFNVCAAYDPRVGEPTARPTGGWVGHKSPPRRGGDSW